MKGNEPRKNHDQYEYYWRVQTSASSRILKIDFGLYLKKFFDLFARNFQEKLLITQGINPRSFNKITSLESAYFRQTFEYTWSHKS